MVLKQRVQRVQVGPWNIGPRLQSLHSYVDDVTGVEPDPGPALVVGGGVKQRVHSEHTASGRCSGQTVQMPLLLCGLSSFRY